MVLCEPKDVGAAFIHFIYFRPKLKHVTCLRKYKYNEVFRGHSVLKEGVLVTQLFDNVGILV